MTVKQISAFVENKPGKLVELCRVLEKQGIDMRALSIAETDNFGVLRLIVDDPERTESVLRDAGYVVQITPVLALQIPDEPGGLRKVLGLLAEGEINLEYTYAFLTRRKGYAYMVLRVADNEKAVKLLADSGVVPVSQSELAALFA